MSVGALHSGTKIGGFRLQDVIGRGGFGITYRAEEPRSGRVYAIKEYLPEDYATRHATGMVAPSQGNVDTYQRGLQAFLTEANILRDLPRRKGLVRVRGAFERFGTAYCVMEFIEGDSLDRMAQRLIRRFGRVPQNLLSDLAISVLWALDALHQERLIHRDVKPANIMLRRSGDPVLIDFGAARRLSRRDKKEIIFTRSYAAIEQMPPDMNGFDRTFAEGPWTDIYSLSVVLYQLVAKRLPPDAITRAKAVLNGEQDPYQPLAETPSLMSGDNAYDMAFLQVIDRGCGLMPKQRYQTAAAMAEQIDPDGWRGIQQSSVNTSEEVIEDDWTIHADSGVEGGPRARRIWPWIAALLVAAGAAIGVYNNPQMIGLPPWYFR